MRQVSNFNDKWAFTKEAGDVCNAIRTGDACKVIPVKDVCNSIPANAEWVNLPHTWNNVDGQDGGNDYYRGTCCYAKEFEKADLPENEQYYLEFLGANASADVYLNGKKMASHDGGYSTWRVNITDALEDKNLLVVLVDNGVNDRVYPQQADFTFYGGLYRDVNLIGVSHSHFDLDYYGGPGIMVTPAVKGVSCAQRKENETVVGQDSVTSTATNASTENTANAANNTIIARVEIEVFLTNAKAGQGLKFKIKDADGNEVVSVKQSASETTATFEIGNVHLWNGRKDPYLYRAEVELTEGEEVLDCVSTRFGCRTFEIHPQKGFILNGESYPLHGVSRHQDRWGVGNALTREHHEEDMDLICEMGANTIRLAHYQHDPYFYDLCDEKGMVTWAEIPYISNHMPMGRENTISQMKELVVQNYNHPSIVVWGLSNEITMTGKSTEDLIDNHRVLNDMVHEMDSTRLTTIAVVSMCDSNDPYIQIPDVVSYNHYFGWYGGDTSMNGPWFDKFHKKFPDIPIGMSEYGCEALNWHTSNPVQGDYTEEYQAFYHEELIKQLFTRPYIWATHVWNMFDFGADSRAEGGENGQNHKGLVTFDRKYKKDSFYAYKAWLSYEPFVHICGKRYVDRVEEETKVTVYSNQPEVELFVNGKSLGRQTSKEHFFYFMVPNKGESVLCAVAGACRDESRIRKVDTFNEEYRLKEQGAVLNWFDITQPQGYYSLNDKVSDIMKSMQGKLLFTSMMAKMRGIMGSKENTFLKPDNLGPMMEMMGGFTVLRLTKLLSAANVEFTKEQLLDLNAKLNKIKRVK